MVALVAVVGGGVGGLPPVLIFWRIVDATASAIRSRRCRSCLKEALQAQTHGAKTWHF
jgi:hypothetical protein